MKLRLILLSVVLVVASCTKVNLEEKAKELCKNHGGLNGFSGSENRAVCSDATVVKL